MAGCLTGHVTGSPSVPRLAQFDGLDLRDYLRQTRSAITGSREALVKLRQYVVIYGDPARTRAELQRSFKKLDENADTLVSAFQSLDGVQAAREEPAALQCLYPGTLGGTTLGTTNIVDQSPKRVPSTRRNKLRSS